MGVIGMTHEEQNVKLKRLLSTAIVFLEGEVKMRRKQSLDVVGKRYYDAMERLIKRSCKEVEHKVQG